LSNFQFYSITVVLIVSTSDCSTTGPMIKCAVDENHYDTQLIARAIYHCCST